MKSLTLSLLLLPLLATGLRAQESKVPAWLIPDFGSTNELVLRAGDGYDGIEAKTHSDLSMTFNAGRKLELFVEYDLVNKQVCGGKLTYRPTSNLNIYAGIMKNPYISELSISPRNLEAVGYSMAASYLGGYGSDLSGISARGRDVGILADLHLLPTSRDFYILRTQLGVFNGNGFCFTDNDHYKDVSGRIDVKPAKYWTLAFGAMYGRYTINNGKGMTYRTTDPDATSAARSRASAALWYDDHRTFVRIEDVMGRTDGMKSNCFSALAGWWITEHISPSARYETFIRDVDDSSTRAHLAVACLTYKWNADINIRLQYNHRWTADDSSSRDYVALGFNLKLNYKNRK